ncbi:MAG: CHASE2 domain-containing protein [Ferruginibacter sp.]
MKRHNILKESVLATVVILIVTYLISFLPLSQEYGKAFHQGLSDFDIYDIHYSGKNNSNSKRDTNIVLVEVGDNRSEIADQINLLSLYHPKVIGLDVLFERPNPNDMDPLGDSVLNNALKNNSNIVLSFRFLDGNSEIPNFFRTVAFNKSGYVNWNGELISVVRTYAPIKKINGKDYESFTTSIARLFDHEKYNKLIQRKSQEELINYTGNIENYTSILKDELKEYRDNGELDRILKNKIVLLGFFVRQNENLQPPLILDDLHFTPLNEKIVSGKSFPDMYGVVIHANILSMILNDNNTRYGTIAPMVISYLFAFVFVFLFNYYIILQFHKKEHPSHGLFLLLQLLLIVVIIYFFLLLFDISLFKVRLEPILIGMVLCLEMLGLYKTIALMLHRKFNYFTIFSHKRIV